MIAVARERGRQLRRDAIGLERGGRQPPARIGDALGDRGHAGHARHLCANQSDYATFCKPAPRLLDEMLGAAIANRAIHESRRAEAASPLASAARLDQVHVAEDRFLGEDERGGGELVEVANQAAADGRLSRTGILYRMKPAAIVIDRGEVVGKIGALDAGQLAQPRRTIIGSRARLVISREELGNHFLALADEKQIDEIGDRLGIEENRGAARDDQRPVAIGAIGAARRNAGHPQTSR